MLGSQFTVAVRAATITVTSTADSGSGTLRKALASAANGDTIDATGVSGTILLTSGELLVTNSLTILGSGPTSLAVNGNAASRVFRINTNTIVIISSLTVTNGRVPGGGGGILNNGSGGSATLTISNCTLSGNLSTNGGGAIYNLGTGGGSASLKIVNCTLSGNSASSGSGGGIFNDAINGSVSLEIVSCTLSGNSAGGGGGGVINSGSNGSATLTIANSTLSGNLASNSGGSVFNSGSNGSATLTIANSILSSNSAVFFGGGIRNGGGAGLGTATVTIANSTLSGNSATGGFSGGGIFNFSAGVSDFEFIQIINSTLSGNSASSGGGVFNWAASGSAIVEVGNSILDAGASGANIVNTSGTITSDGYNLSSDGGGGFLTATGDQINTNPKLGPLQDNGGPTFTHVLLPGSPAIDKGKNPSGSATDQRGQPRRFDDPDFANASGGDGTDIGAYEMINLRITAVQKAGNDLQISFTSGAVGKYVVESPSDLLTGAWAALPGTNAGTGVIVQIIETNALTEPQQFYRIHQLP